MSLTSYRAAPPRVWGRILVDAPAYVVCFGYLLLGLEDLAATDFPAP